MRTADGSALIQTYPETRLVETFPVLPSDSIWPAAFAVGMRRKSAKNNGWLFPAVRKLRARTAGTARALVCAGAVFPPAINSTAAKCVDLAAHAPIFYCMPGATTDSSKCNA